MTDYTNRAAFILSKVRYLALATSSKDGLPWNTPLGYKIDEELHFYWVSEYMKQHSRNIKENENVFIAIYDSNLPEEKGEAVYISAKAQELSKPDEIEYARKLFKGTSEDALVKLSGGSLRRAYRAIPRHIWINGPKDNDSDTWRDTRFEIAISDLKHYFPDIITS